MNKEIVLDIGANEGNDGLSFSLLLTNCQIYAFEPNKKLSKTIILNKKKIEKTIGSKITNYKLINKAISTKNTTSIFNISKNVGAHSLYKFKKNVYRHKRHQKGYEIEKKVRVKVLKLSTFLKYIKFSRIKYLHCDAQGSDLNVLKSLDKYIKYLDEGVVEASNKNKALYDKSNNSLSNVKKFLIKKNFSITKIKSNDPFSNELNVYFKNNNISKNEQFLNSKEKYLLRFYQKFIRKIIMGHYKIFLYKIVFKLINFLR